MSRPAAFLLAPPAAKLVLLAAAVLLASSARAGWRDRQIDGSSAGTFERSVAMLQNDLPSRRREEFEVAVVVIWMRAASLGSADADGDGDVDYSDARATADGAADLLAAMQRGDLVSAIEKSKRGAAAPSFFTKLDGLSANEVVELAGDNDIGPYLAEMRRRRAQAACLPLPRWRNSPPLGQTSRINNCG